LIVPADKRRIHITAVASFATRDVDRLSPDGVKGVQRLAREGVGGRYEVTVNPRLMYKRDLDDIGDRDDDAARAREVEAVLADDNVAALVTLRGGAWFTRILDRINFDVLKNRRTTIHLFGFSEMTTLINIAGQYPKVVAAYDMGPGFLFYGPQRYAFVNFGRLSRGTEAKPEDRRAFATGWAVARYPQLFVDFFRDVADILDGKGSQRVPTGRLVSGLLPPVSRITVVGGTLSVTLPLMGTRYAGAVETRGNWIALEDLNEAPDPIDRMMAGLQLNGLFERAQGVILGDFHDHDTDLCEVAQKILRHHLPAGRKLPVVYLENFGHVWPLAPLVMHRELMLRCEARSKRVTIETPWSQWADR
jgi:muramoyltetrapeptide carboxypeptidase